MAGIYNADQSAMLKIQEVGDTIFIAEETKYPFARLLKRGEKPKQELCQWPLQKYPDRTFEGILDGVDMSDYSHTSREYAEAYCMIMRSAGWLVSQLAAVTRTAGVKNEKAKQMADDALILAAMVEKQLLSDMDTRVQAGSDPFRSRGAFSWLSTAEQAQKPVPVNFRPASGAHYTGAVASFVPASLEAMLAISAAAKKGAVDLTGFVGLTLKRTMSLWPQLQQGSANPAKTMMVFNADVADKTLMEVVDIFKFDAGMVKTVPSWYLLCTAGTGAVSASSAKSGLFLDMSMWELCFLQNVMSKENPDLGAGERGYHDAIYILKCLNPLGQNTVNTAS